MERLLSKVTDYLGELIPHLEKGENGVFTCPVCNELSCHATFKTYRLSCANCRTEMGDITDVVRRFEADKKSCSKDEIIFYLKNKYNIDILTNRDVQFALDLYEKYRFDLTPIVRNQKIPIEKDWLNKTHLNKADWKDWLNDGLNIGIKTGNKSGITVIDVDTKEIHPSLLSILSPTLTQETTKGYHYIYQFEPSLHTSRIDDMKVDILNDGKQFVAFPSVIDNIRRRITNPAVPISKMSPELVKFIQARTTPLQKTFSEKVKEDIALNDFSDVNISPVEEGSRTNFLIKMGGTLRKQLNISETEYVLRLLNGRFCKPYLPEREFRNIINSIDRYVTFDDQELAHKILVYLKIVEEATSRDVKEALGEGKEQIDKGLAFLLREGYVVRKRRMFVVVKHVEWKDTFQEDGSHITFDMPYFKDVAHFRNGDMILIGGQQKVGKSHIALNIVKQLIQQNIKPYYINLESGNRFASISKMLQLKDGDFWNATHFAPENVELEKNAVTIIDWLLPKDYSETDKLFQYFAQQLVKNGGILIVFVQLKEKGDFFAGNMIAMFPALVARYFYEKNDAGIEDPTKGRFQVDYVRESKTKQKKMVIPCEYNWDTKELNVVNRPPENENPNGQFIPGAINE